jgi:hypothetical protein
VMELQKDNYLRSVILLQMKLSITLWFFYWNMPNDGTCETKLKKNASI